MYYPARCRWLWPAGGKGKRKRGSGTKDGDAQDKDSAPAQKRQQAGKGDTSGSGGESNAPRFTKEQEEEALEGVQLTLRDARKKRKLCKRCGGGNHL